MNLSRKAPPTHTLQGKENSKAVPLTIPRAGLQPLAIVISIYGPGSQESKKGRSKSRFPTLDLP